MTVWANEAAGVPQLCWLLPCERSPAAAAVILDLVFVKRAAAAAVPISVASMLATVRIHRQWQCCQ